MKWYRHYVRKLDDEALDALLVDLYDREGALYYTDEKAEARKLRRNIDVVLSELDGRYATLALFDERPGYTLAMEWAEAA